jgi:hypothetical protein
MPDEKNLPCGGSIKSQEPPTFANNNNSPMTRTPPAPARLISNTEDGNLGQMRQAALAHDGKGFSFQSPAKGRPGDKF